MKKIILASAIASAFAAQGAAAADEAPAAAPAATPEHVVTYNLGVTSDYVFRGISQSRNRPAVSAGVDYSHTPSGFYVGTWASTISWVNDSYPAGDLANRANTPMEVDFYGGFKGEAFGGLGFDVGAIHYHYPHHQLKNVAAPAAGPLAGAAPGGLDANTTEVYGKVSYGPVYLKVNYAIGDAIFVSNKAGSIYYDLGADVPVMEGLVVNLHYGRWNFKNDPGFNDPAYPATIYNYSDWKIGLTKDFGSGLSGSIAATGTNATNIHSDGVTGVWNFNNTGYLGGNKFIASLTKTF